MSVKNGTLSNAEDTAATGDVAQVAPSSSADAVVMATGPCNSTFYLPHVWRKSACIAVLWRHVEATGGTSLRNAFERLELTTSRWAAFHRVERSSATPFKCIRSPLRLARPAALDGFTTCARRHPREPKMGWSIEYHVPSDASSSFAAHTAALSVWRPMNTLRDAGVVIATVVRQPLFWYASQYRAPTRNAYKPLARRAANVSVFAAAVGANLQWRALTLESGFGAQQAAGAKADDSPFASAMALLARFDVVGVTERLPAFMLLVCYAAGLQTCPRMEIRARSGSVDRGLRRRRHQDAIAKAAGVHPSESSGGAIDRAAADPEATQFIASFAPLDVTLHRLAAARMDSELGARSLDARARQVEQAYIDGHRARANPLSIRPAVAAVASLSGAASAQCQLKFKWDWRSAPPTRSSDAAFGRRCGLVPNS